jgi:hypothetical protein
MTAIPWVSELLRGLIGEPVSVVAKIIQKKSRQHAPPRIAAPDFFSCFLGPGIVRLVRYRRNAFPCKAPGLGPGIVRLVR